eukprot:GFUD01069719.1.p1 GENE.GFUD01069719.1~~GFUD01069719.1.p1  ORF type:complete len:103 (+),score=3.88 GFUD01069719.1:1349-1657(+)
MPNIVTCPVHFSSKPCLYPRVVQKIKIFDTNQHGRSTHSNMWSDHPPKKIQLSSTFLKGPPSHPKYTKEPPKNTKEMTPSGVLNFAHLKRIPIRVLHSRLHS